MAARSKRRDSTASSISTHSHPKVAAPYIKKQEKSVDYFLYFANLFQNREWDKYNGHVVVIQMN
ncbi:hypothetical protein FXE07_01885 [Aggregatibacter actinomycetemcomitans]|nr:hypothetical protein FXE08_04005 [Aggregatibacter actinomycetemcomitans]TYB11686.1 hypothetical protein FXE07_01885 [Aggregatibacter actinomycetemcomitans]